MLMLVMLVNMQVWLCHVMVSFMMMIVVMIVVLVLNLVDKTSMSKHIMYWCMWFCQDMSICEVLL